MWRLQKTDRMSDDFKYTSDPADLTMAACIAEDAEKLLAGECAPSEITNAIERLDGVIVLLEGKIDKPAKPRMITALRVKAQLLLKLGNTQAAVAHLNEALELTVKYGEDETEAMILFELLCDHSPEFREGLQGLASISNAIPSGC